MPLCRYTLNAPTTTVQVAHNIALKLLRRGYLYFHDLLKEHLLSLLHGILQSKNRGHFKSQLRRVDLVITTEDEANP